MSTEKLKIAICGGGIASLCLAHALANNPRLDVKVFEKSAVLRDEGASVGLGSNAQEALALISPELRAAVDEAGGVPMDPSLTLSIATGPESGQLIGHHRPTRPQIVVYWGSLYKALYNRIPQDSLHLNKGTTSIDELDNKLRVNFEDNTSYTADLVIGCDGINSVVRKSILGPDHPAATAVYSSRYAHRVVVPVETAKTIFGDKYCDIKTQHGHVGDGLLLLTDFAERGTAMQVIADFPTPEPWSHSSPFIEWPKETLKQNLEPCGKIGEAMTKLFLSQPSLYAAGLRVHPPTPTFYRNNMCIAGDAALSFLPFQGAGAGQAIEDALILSRVLNAIESSDDILPALKGYDSVRRPRRTQTAQSSEWASLVITGTHPDIGLSVEKLRLVLENWGRDIYAYDQEGGIRRALEVMRAEKEGRGSDDS